MSGYSREHPDEPELTVDEIEERAERRRELRQRLREAPQQTLDEIRSESERHQVEDLLRAETEDGTDWHDYVGGDRDDRDE